jgi:hypothetical protein
MRTIREYKVVKTTFYINDADDYGLVSEDVATFDNKTDAEWFCEENVNEMCVNDNERLEVWQCFNEDEKIYVVASYC